VSNVLITDIVKDIPRNGYILVMLVFSSKNNEVYVRLYAMDPQNVCEGVCYTITLTLMIILSRYYKLNNKRYSNDDALLLLILRHPNKE